MIVLVYISFVQHPTREHHLGISWQYPIQRWHFLRKNETSCYSHQHSVNTPLLQIFNRNTILHGPLYSSEKRGGRNIKQDVKFIPLTDHVIVRVRPIKLQSVLSSIKHQAWPTLFLQTLLQAPGVLQYNKGYPTLYHMIGLIALNWYGQSCIFPLQNATLKCHFKTEKKVVVPFSQPIS